MIYLDYNASTPIAPEVARAIEPYLTTTFGNPSSAHMLGAPLRTAVEVARTRVASLLAAEAAEIVFTSGGTEANNHVIKGVAHTLRDKGRHIIISAVEHPAVTEPCRYLQAYGYEITVMGVDQHGMVDPDELRRQLRRDTILVSVMLANNEVGTIQPMAEIGRIAHEAGVWLHTDAAQAVGKIPVNVETLGVDFLSLAGHKLYAPQGVGAFYIRREHPIEPLMHGAGHESGRRAGTEAVANIVGLGEAATLAATRDPVATLTPLRDHLGQQLSAALRDRMSLNGHPTERLPNTLNVSFKGLTGRDLLAATPQICASPGAACHSGERRPSAVLAAMGVPDDMALGAVRLSLGIETTKMQVEQAADMLIASYARLSSEKKVQP